MLPKNKRIPRELINNLLKQKRYFNTTHLTLMVAPNEGSGPRVAASVSKKVAKLAVARNTYRRRIYSVARLLIRDLKPNLYLIVAKKGVDKLKRETLESELGELFNAGNFIVSNGKKG